MRQRWLSGRAVVLHVAAVVLATGCALASWWQITRAEDGNQLSYFYSAMWPAFGILVIVFWWSLLHTDFETAGRKGVQRQQAAADRDAARGEDVASVGAPSMVTAEEDPELAAYNARLAELATQGPKTWRHPEPVITRAAPARPPR